jgi:hypothetical protein
MAFTVSSADNAAQFALGAIEGDARRAFEARIGIGDSLSVRRRVAVDRDGLAAFWRSIADHWAELPEDLVWEARDPALDYGPPALRLTATSEGHTTVVVVVEMALPFIGNDLGTERSQPPVGMRDPRTNGAWRVRAVLVVEPWQLDDIASTAGRLPYSSEGWW